jgi:hypothetical protein
MKQLGGGPGGGAARRLARALDGPRKRDLPSQIGHIVAEALDRLVPPESPYLRHKQPTRAGPSCRRASMAPTLRLAGWNADSMRAYLAAREKERRETMQSLNTPADSQGASAAPLCVICLQEREDESAPDADGVTPTLLEALPCGHVFHRACITQWLQYRRCCPIDRLSVDAKEVAESGG